jgi:hypothetical protein
VRVASLRFPSFVIIFYICFHIFSSFLFSYPFLNFVYIFLKFSIFIFPQIFCQLFSVTQILRSRFGNFGGTPKNGKSKKKILKKIEKTTKNTEKMDKT